MGNFFKAKPQTTTASPWGPQGDALKTGYSDASNYLTSKLGTPYYSGELYAGMDPMTDQGIQANAGYATGVGADRADAVGATGSEALANGGKATSAYDQLAAMAGQDPTQANITSAGEYADNPYMSGMIDAASRDIQRNLYENDIPGIDTAAVGSGNINSSRAGVAEGIAMRGAQDQIGDIAAQMRGSAYNQGLALAEQARQANMGGLGSAGSGYNEGYDLGLKGSALGQDMTFNNDNQLISGGQLYQKDAQGQDDAAFQQWQGQDQRDAQTLNNYFQWVNGGSPGGTQTTTGAQASPFQQLIGGAVSALGAYKSFSDRRLKRCIVKLGERQDGLGIYSFKYRQDMGISLPTGSRVGFMADEVRELYPEAVSLKDGYLQVDYGKL